jgi:hypothetical protein
MADKKPDSVIKNEKFEDLMKRYHGQMENALYAAEQACPQPDAIGIHACGIISCPFHRWRCEETGISCDCELSKIRLILGHKVEQHDIEIPEDNTQAIRKSER